LRIFSWFRSMPLPQAFTSLYVSFSSPCMFVLTSDP
jgi:hypothetical protein